MNATFTRSALLTLLSLLAGCASPPLPSAPTSPPDLAAIVAPEPVRPELVAPLTALLHGDRSPVLLTVGAETVRCEVSIEPARSAASCGGVVEEAPTVAGLVRKLHAGDWMQRLVQSRVSDAQRLTEHTGLALYTLDLRGTVAPSGGSAEAHYLDYVLGWTHFTVGARGATVRATFTSLDGPETLEASSLSALGQRLRERQAELIAEAKARAVRDQNIRHLSELLAEVTRRPDGRWVTRHGVVVGQTRLGHIASGSLQFEPLDPDNENWSAPPDTIVVVTERRPGAERRGSWLASYDSTVVQASIGQRRQEADPALDCTRYDEWLSGRQTPFRRSPPAAPESCRWSWSDADHRLDLEVSTWQVILTVTWQPVRFEQTRHEPAFLARPRPRRPTWSTRKHWRSPA